MTDEIKVPINGDSKGFDKAAKKAQGSAKSMSLSMAKSFATAGAAFIAVGAVITTKLLSAYNEQAQAEKGIQQTLKATGYAAGLTAQELYDMAGALQKVTTFGDETILGGQKLLLTFKNIGEKTFPRATAAMLDMAQSMDMDLKGAAIQMGKALNDPRTGLSMLTRVGITFTDEQKKMIKTMQATGDMAGAQAVILEELESQFKGAAEAAAKAGTGGLSQFLNVTSDIAEKLGGKLLPALNFIVKPLTEIASKVDKALAMTDAQKGINDVGKEIEKLISRQKIWAALPFGLGKKQVAEYQQNIDALKLALFSMLDAGVSKTDEAEKRKAKIRAAAKKKEIDAANAQADLQAQKDEMIIESLDRQSDAEEAFRLAKEEADASSRDNDLEAIQAQIAAEKAIKEEGKIQELIDKGKFEAAKSKIDIKSRNDKKKIEQDKLADKKAFFSAAMSLANSENSALAAIGKAAALTQIAIQTPPAIASSFRFGTTTGGPILGAVLGGIAATAMAAQAAKVAGISGFSEGGIIPDGDDRVIGVKKREMVLTEQDQSSLLDMIRGGEGSGGGSIEINLTMSENLIDFIEAEVIERRATGTSEL